MNNSELMFVLLLGVVLMCIPISIQMNWYGIAIWKSIIVSAALAYTGVLGSRIWYYVENGSFLGRSFYGAIFFAPITFFPVAKVLNTAYGEVLDFCAPAGCLTLAMVKIQCLRDGCCGGMALGLDENYNYVLFPSQIVEMITFLIIACILMLIGSMKSNRTKIFPWFLILYGGSRFVLDFFRGGIVPYAMGLSAGSFWSLVAFTIGITVLLIMRAKSKPAGDF